MTRDRRRTGHGGLQYAVCTDLLCPLGKFILHTVQLVPASIVHVHTLEHYKMFNLVENFSISKTSENTLNLSMLSKVLYESRSERDWWAVPTPTLRSGHFLSLCPLFQSLLSGIILVYLHSFDCIFIYFRTLTQNQQWEPWVERRCPLNFDT